MFEVWDCVNFDFLFVLILSEDCVTVIEKCENLGGQVRCRIVNKGTKFTSLQDDFDSNFHDFLLFFFFRSL